MRAEYNFSRFKHRRNPYAQVLKKRKSAPVVVKEAQRTCRWCPSAWEGVTVDSRPIYARYRHGRLSVRVGRRGGSIGQAVRLGKEVIDAVIGDGLDGFLTYAELKQYTKKLVLWPARAKDASD